VEVGGEVDVPAFVQCSARDDSRRVGEPRGVRVLIVARCQVARRHRAVARHYVHVLRAVEHEVFTVQAGEERFDLPRRHPRCVILGVALVLCARSEGDQFSAWRPFHRADAIGHRRNRANLAARSDRDDAQRGLALLLAAAAREGEPRSVRRPRRIAVALLAGGQRAWRTRSVGGSEPDLRAVLVRLLVDAHDDVGDVLAVGGDDR